MVEVLLALHFVMLAAMFGLLQRHLGRIIAIVFAVYMFAFTVLKPALLFYFDLYLPFSTNEKSAVEAMLVGSLIFLIVFYATTRLLGNYRPSRVVVGWFDFSRATPRGIWLTFLFLMAVSFVGSVIKFADLGYLVSSASTFDATTNQANGSWYITYVAEILFQGAVMVMAFYCSRLPPMRSLALMLGVLAVTYLWAKVAARTGMLVILIAWLACSLSFARQRALNIVYVALFGYVLLILLYIGNLARLGNVGDIDASTAIFGAAVAAASDLSPVDTSVLLYSEMDRHESTHFLQLAGALTPMVLIPSSLFPLKLPADKDSELTRQFFPEGADTTFYHEGSTLTFTVPGSGFADGGYLGVVVSSLVYSILFCIYLWMYRLGTTSTRFVTAVLILVHIVGYRLSAESLLMTFYTSLLLIGGARWLAVALSGRRRRGVKSLPRLNRSAPADG